MTDWEDWPEELKDFWENTAGYHQGYLNHSEMEDFISESEELFWSGWGHADEGESEDRQAARDAFFELMAQYDLDSSLFDWDDWRDWYESA